MAEQLESELYRVAGEVSQILSALGSPQKAPAVLEQVLRRLLAVIERHKEEDRQFAEAVLGVEEVNAERYQVLLEVARRLWRGEAVVDDTLDQLWWRPAQADGDFQEVTDVQRAVLIELGGRGPEVDSPEAHPEFCHMHGFVESLPPGAPGYHRCFECGHLYVTALDLEKSYLFGMPDPVSDVFGVLDGLPKPAELSKEQEEAYLFPLPAHEIPFCPECLHDF